MRKTLLTLVFGFSTIGWGVALCAEAEVTAVGFAPAIAPSAAAAEPANFRLSFLTAAGTEASPVHVLIRDRAGATWLEQTTQIPAIAVRMPPGSYDIAATYNGQRLTRDVAISPDERYLGNFVWR